MTDGPFRNAELPSRWKRYGRDLVSDATSQEERVARVSHNMLSDIDLKSFRALWGVLAAYAQRPQMDLDSVSSVEALFEAHATSPCLSIFQKHVISNLRFENSVQAALEQGLVGAADEWRETTKNRFDEHCLEARDRGDMNAADYSRGISRNRETFDAISLIALCDALRAGQKNAFRPELQKKKGIDEGPEE